MDTTVTDPLRGALLGGRYRVVGRLAQGGMATVYQARDERLGRLVAVKLIHPGLAADASLPGRLANEARTVARLAHPNIVAVYDQGTHDNAPYLVMEYVHGRTLREVLDERGHLDPTDALAVLEQVLAALSVAHRAGLVHRDVKPENILVAVPPKGSGDLVDAVVKVADFGLAHAVGGFGGAGRRSSTGGPDEDGQVLATAAYVAPELVAHGRADPRADIYSTGIVLFELLTGRVPFEGEQAREVSRQHVERDVPPPSSILPGLPARLDTIVVRATSRDPDGRPRDAAILLAEVRAARDAVNALAGPTRVLDQPTMLVTPVSGGGPAAGPLGGPTTVMPTVGLGRGAPGPGQGADPRPAWARLPASRATQTGHGARDHDARGHGARDRSAGGHGARGHSARGHSAGGHGVIEAARQRVAQLATAEGIRNAWASARWSARSMADRLQRTQRGRAQLVAALVVIGLVLLVGGWWLGFGRYTEAPMLLQLTKANAAQEAARLGFDVEYGAGRYDESVPIDTVLAQDPTGGGRILRSGTVTVFLSLGPERYKVPDVSGQAQDFATAQLREHFVVQTSDGYSDNLPVGYVMGTDPAAGTALKPNATVTLIVVKGGFPVHVPAVVGKQRDEAERQLRAAGFDVEVQQRDDQTKKRDLVLEQNPAAGQGMVSAQGVKVTIVVATGPPGVPMPSLLDAGCADAANLLQSVGLAVQVDGNDLDQRFGRVRQQSPEPGKPVQPGEQVALICRLF